jgi:hypothetical protein
MVDLNCTDPTPPAVYGYLSTESTVFRVVACYQEVAHDCKNWDPVYCSSLLIYCILSLLNEYLLGHVMYFYSQSNLEGSIFAKLKMWILLMCMLMFLCEFLRNFFNVIPLKINLGLLYLE